MVPVRIFDHPAFPQPENSFAQLWRYMDFPKFEDIATNSALYMPRSDQLGDPFEGSTPEAELAIWDEAAAKAGSDEKRAIVLANRQKISDLARTIQTRHFVSCWHMNEVENHAMWRCYTKDTEAVAITTTYDSLGDQLPDDAYIGLVRYIDYQIERLPTMNLFQQIMHKRHFFAFENEVRAVYSLAFADPRADEDDIAMMQDQLAEPGYSAPVNIQKLIHDVYVHPAASEKCFKKVMTLCEEVDLPRPTLSGISGEPVY